VVIHKEHKIYVPELVFGHLLTSSNYDDKEKKTTGGRNGYGAKLTNIFSKNFSIETADSSHRKKFKQSYSNNMTKRSEPKIEDFEDTALDYTIVSFEPDFSKFDVKGLTDDIVSLMYR
jgi:DNA topoisomerase II